MNISSANIVETGYSQDLRFIVASTQLYYSGYYHKDNKGLYWTGEFHTPESQTLTDTRPPIVVDNNYVAKNQAGVIGFTKKYNNVLEAPLLSSDFIRPDFLEYSKGYFTRYFAQLKLTQTPERNIYELNEINYKKLINNTVALQSYNTISIPWKLIGPVYDVYNNNVRVDDGVYDTNLRIVTQAEKTIPGLSAYLNDFLQFSTVNDRILSAESGGKADFTIIDFGFIREEIDLSIPEAPSPSVTYESI